MQTENLQDDVTFLILKAVIVLLIFLIAYMLYKQWKDGKPPDGIF
jgi:hypothetical protein